MIRRARVADVPALAALHIRAHDAAYSGYVAAERMAAFRDPAAREAAWRERAELDNPVTFVDDDVSGFVTVGTTRDKDTGGDGELYALYVDPALIGTGRGRALLEAGEAWLRERYACATLWVFERNAQGRRFYERAGWCIDERPFDRDRWGWAPSVRYRRCWARQAGAEGA